MSWRFCFVFLLFFAVAASLRAEASTVRGVVTDQTGAPIPQASVGLYSASGDWETATGNDGGFSFNGMDAGLYELQVKAQGFTPKLIKEFKIGTADPPIVTIELKVGSCPPCCSASNLCTIADTTYRETQGRPALQGQLFTACKEWTIANVKVALIREGQTISTVTTGRDGRFQFKDLEPGRYDLWFSGVGEHPDFADFNLRIKHRKIAILREHISNQWISVTLACPTSIKIKGSR